ncbi:hypothetical protein ABZS61_18380 [Streptomyces sp. NPDC005566]|uniref:hypothetical protein n=1 Tax=Streptomyces sp. NPDC005566 TaxID=3156886 RepID=UPI0033B5B543
MTSCSACASRRTDSWAALRPSQTPAMARPSTIAYTTPIIIVMYSMTSGVSDGSSSSPMRRLLRTAMVRTTAQAEAMAMVRTSHSDMGFLHRSSSVTGCRSSGRAGPQYGHRKDGGSGDHQGERDQ